MVCSQWAAVHRDEARGAALWEAVDLSDVVGDPRNRRSDELEGSCTVSSLRLWLQRRCRPGGGLRQLQLARAPVSDGYPGAHLPLVRGVTYTALAHTKYEPRGNRLEIDANPCLRDFLHSCHTPASTPASNWSLAS